MRAEAAAATTGLRRRLALTAFKGLVSALALGFVGTRIDRGELAALLRGVDRVRLGAAVACLAASNVLASVQWHRLLRAGGARPTWPQALRIYFIGLFFNNFLPANIGGDAVKVYDVARSGDDVYDVIAATLLDRVIGIAALAAIATACAAGLAVGGAARPYAAWAAVFAAGGAAAWALYRVRATGTWLRALVRGRFFGAGDRLVTLLDALGRFRGRDRLVGGLLAFSFLVQGLRVTTHVLMASALGVALAPATVVRFFVIVPVLAVAMIPPVTINGLGVREGLGVVLFAEAGLGRADAFAVEFLTWVASVAVSLVGWPLFVARRRRAASARA